MATQPYQRALRALKGWKPEEVVLRGASLEALAGLALRPLAEQLALKQKARRKLPSYAAEASLLIPTAQALEQSSSEVTAQAKRRLLTRLPGTAVLADLSAGLGVDVCAFAPDFGASLAVERDPALARVLQHNVTQLGLAERITVAAKAAEAVTLAVFAAGRPLVVFVDPSRRDSHGRRRYSFEDTEPNLLALLPRLPPETIQVLIKAAPRLDLRAALRSLDGLADWRVERVLILAWRGDCREVLYSLRRRAEVTAATLVEAVHLTPSRTELWQQSWEPTPPPVPVGPVATYLYDPNPALRKLHHLGTFCRALGLHQVAANTLLLTAEELLPGFPGRVFKVLDGPLKAPHKRLQSRRASVLTRNFPTGAEALRKRWHLGEDELHFIIAFRDQVQRPCLYLAERLFEGTR